MSVPSLGRLAWKFLRIGNTTFGGGYPTIAALQRELVGREGWLSQEDFSLAFSLARLTPGTTLLAFCAATGGQILGLRGATAAVLAETLPSAALAVLLTDGYQLWGSNPIVMAIVGGAAAAVAGMMWSAAWTIARPYLGSPVRPANILRVVLLSGGTFLAAWRFGITPIPILGVAALVGLLWKEPAKP
jgi:chromate transporter